eukprot:symbB.v1.2.023156.t3/scaffold2099.1/size89596/3
MIAPRETVMEILKEANGVLHYEVVASKLAEALQRAQPETGEAGDLKLLALASIPLDFCNETDPFVRYPAESSKKRKAEAMDIIFTNNDQFIAGVRQRMVSHAERFGRRSSNSQLLHRYLDSCRDWAEKKETAQIFRHAFHVAAWFSMFSFATLASNLELEQVADLLMKMLQLCHVEPTPELRGGLRSTHGRTDVAFVRHVLGRKMLPEGYHIRWDGLRKRWLAQFRGKTLAGSNAASSRFTDDAAIKHIYAVCTKHARLAEDSCTGAYYSRDDTKYRDPFQELHNKELCKPENSMALGTQRCAAGLCNLKTKTSSPSRATGSTVVWPCGAPERIARLHPLAQRLRRRADEVEWYAEHGAQFLKDSEYPTLPGFKRSFVTYQPLGVILSIMPWNFPMWQVIRMGVPTLMAGNAVLLKHAHNCFGSGLLCEELIKDLDLPEGLFRSLIVDVPETHQVLEHPLVQGVALTGSEVAGRAVAAKAGSLLKKAVSNGSISPLNNARYRVNVAVCFFVVVSGFVTHYSSGSRQLANAVELLGFYLRRLGRILFTFWIAMLWAVYLLERAGSQHLPLDYVVKCVCLVEQWFKWCPNGPSWFVFALLPSWILYPLTRKLLAIAEDSGGVALITLQAILFLLSTGPAILLLLINGNITMQQHNDMMFWPPSQLADFMMGMTTAALVRHYKGTRLPMADVSLLLVVLVVFFLPRPSETYEMHLNGWEPLLDHGLAPLMSAFILASCADSEHPGCSARLLAHPALVSLGEISFQVYIFQRPMHDTVKLLMSTDQMDAESPVAVVHLFEKHAFMNIWVCTFFNDQCMTRSNC